MNDDTMIEEAAKAIYEHSETNDDGDTCLGCGTFTGNDLALHQARVAAQASHAAVLTWFAEKYAGFASHEKDPMVKYAYKSASAFAEAEAESLGDQEVPVNDADRARVIRDILSYRLLSEPVIEYLTAYLSEIEGE